MKAPVKMSSANKGDLNGLMNFSADFTSQMRSLVNLGAKNRTYGSILCRIILEKVSNELLLIISRNTNEIDWNFTKVLDLISVELRSQVPLKNENFNNNFFLIHSVAIRI